MCSTKLTECTCPYRSLSLVLNSQGTLICRRKTAAPIEFPKNTSGKMQPIGLSPRPHSASSVESHPCCCTADRMSLSLVHEACNCAAGVLLGYDKVIGQQ